MPGIATVQSVKSKYRVSFFLREKKFVMHPGLGKTKAIRRIAVRETSVSRHHGGPIEGPPENPPYITTLSY